MGQQKYHHYWDQAPWSCEETVDPQTPPTAPLAQPMLVVPSDATEHALDGDTVVETHDKIKHSISDTDKIPSTETPRPKPAPPPLPITPQLANASSSVATEHAINIKRDVFKPLLAQCQWEEQNRSWRLPETQLDARLLALDWPRMIHSASDKVARSVLPTFYPREPDHNQHDKPRLDLVVSFADGTSVRYHPSATPIWSDETQPTDAMQKRYNRAEKLAKEQQS